MRSSYSASIAPIMKSQRSMFDRPFTTRTMFDEGKLIPFFRTEVNPGESLSINPSVIVRTQPTVKPLMSNLYLHVAYFFVPYRIIWDNFEKFFGERDNPDDDPEDYTTPQVVTPAVTGVVVEETFDYLGVPIGIASKSLNAWFSRSYNFIWNTYFRDQNIHDSVVVDTGDGPDDYDDYKTVLRVKKQPDYFSSALPFAQKHDPVELPLGDYAPITLNPPTGAIASGKIRKSSDGSLNTENSYLTGGATTTGYFQTATGPVAATYDPNGSLIANLSTAVGATVNELRQMIALQQLYELEARGGSRYSEICLSLFGVQSPDTRVYKPELLSVARESINIAPVIQSTPTATSALGNIGGIGYTRISRGFTKSFTEHGCVIGVAYVKAESDFCQGLHRDWTRRTREEFLIPGLQGVGEQAIRLDEIYCQGTAEDDDVFAYQERYAEMKHGESLTTGKMRPNYSTPLDAWHLCHELSGKPTFNEAFIEENAPMDRVLEVTDEPHFQLDSYIMAHHVRPLQTWSIPGLNRL
ncbi:MAG: major capsid protein [Arizlama microvirus]|nr:MAG: major capsid protein [Arizlama microvirus]